MSSLNQYYQHGGMIVSDGHTSYLSVPKGASVRHIEWVKERAVEDGWTFYREYEGATPEPGVTETLLQFSRRIAKEPKKRYGW